MWSGRSEDENFRRDVTRAIATQSMEFREHNIEYGYTYTSPDAAIVQDSTLAPAPIDTIRTYQPSTAPGHPLPHAWLNADDGQRLSTLDLVAPGRFLLIAGEEGQAWCEAAGKVAARTGIDLDATSIGHLAGDYLDPRCGWLQRREISPDGAILVRPDRFIAWRSMGGSATPNADLEQALEKILSTASMEYGS